MQPLPSESMNQLSAQFGAFAVTAFIVYLILRAVAARRPGAVLAQARRHALWCAVIGFFATTSSDWFDAFYSVPTEPGQNLEMWAAVGMAVTPAAWLLFVYVAGQFTWPRNLKPQRSASLQPRSLTGLVPKLLTGVLAATLICLGIALWAVRDVTAISPRAARIVEREDYWAQYSAQSGIRGFAEILPMTLIAAGALVLTVLLVTLLVLLRKPLPGISDHDNRLLRRTWLNRLFRTAIVALSTLAGSVLHYKARWLSRNADEYADNATKDTLDHYYQLSDAVGQWDSVANNAVAGIALLMLFWRPPSDFEGLAPQRALPVKRLRDQLFSMQFLSSTVTVLLIVIIGGLTAYESSSPTSLSPERVERSMLLYVGIGLFYLLSNAVTMTYTHISSRQAAVLPKSYRRLPLWSYLAAGVLSLCALILMLWPPVDLLWGVIPARPLVILALVLLLLGAFVGFRYFVQRLTLPWDVDPEMEIWYRRVLELRALRAVTTVIVAMPLGAYPFPAGTVVFALIIFLIPSALILERPDLRRQRELAETQRTS